MLHILPFRVTLRSRQPGRRGGAIARLAATALAALGLSQALPSPIAFGQSYYSGSVSATITIFQGVKSVTLSQSSLALGNCNFQSGTSSPNGLPLPDGRCDTTATPVTITSSGNVGTVIYVNGADAVPSDGGTPNWTLCSSQTLSSMRYTSSGSTVPSSGATGSPACTEVPGTIDNSQTVNLASGSSSIIPTGGTFALTVNGCTSPNIAFPASAADVQNALGACVGGANVSVAQTALYTYVIRFGGAYYDPPPALMSATVALSPSNAAIVISETSQPGADQYRLSLRNTILSPNGTFPTNALICDAAFNQTFSSGCSAVPEPPGYNTQEVMTWSGPATTTDKSPTFHTTVSWTAT